MILIHSGSSVHQVYQCASESEMILTPTLDYQNDVINFAVDKGTGIRAVHSLKLSLSERGTWEAFDSLLIEVNGGSWPHLSPDGDLYLIMKDPSSLDATSVTDLYQINNSEYTRISANEGGDRHLWTLISPDNKFIHYRKIRMIPEADQPDLKESILYNIADQSSETHQIHPEAFIEQWTSSGSLLYSLRLADESRSRAYYLYDVGSKESQELYRSVCWQARLSNSSKYLTLLQTSPAEGAMFDVFLVNLENGKMTNLSQTPQLSESMIGWLD